jgi:hypothetical protein
MRPQLEETLDLAVQALARDADRLTQEDEISAELVLAHGFMALTLAVGAAIDELENIHNSLKQAFNL